MHVIGTAGHVDHGKSTLIEALTGVHPDRLQEEQKREMTIDLGFGWLSLDNGQEVGIVDVPGHIDFIGNLLSGIGGIDAVLFVVAADEGIMPQTVEHEAIVRLLQISHGIIVITKTDLVNDPGILTLMKEEIRLLVKGSGLEDSPIVEVSAKTGWGMEPLKSEISTLLAALPEKNDLGRPRLPVDRVFQLQGIGTVVTGTLQDGHFSVGETVVAAPEEKKGRIRELQIHGKKVDLAAPGNRVAINISGLSKQDIRRGDVICLPGRYEPTRRMDVYITALPELSKPLTHNSHVQLFIGAKALDARVRVIGIQQLMPGDQGFLQLELDEPVVAARNDRLILRRFSPSETIGGGVVLKAHPAGRYKRFDDGVLERLNSLLAESPAELISSYLQGIGISGFSDVCTDLQLSQEVVLTLLNEFANSGEVLILSQDATNKNNWIVVHESHWKMKQVELLHFLKLFHEKYPLLPGATLLQIREHLKCDAILLENILLYLLENNKIKNIAEHTYAREEHKIRLTRQQMSALERVKASLKEQGHKPPAIKEINSQIGQNMVLEFIQAGLLIKVSDDLVYLPEQLDAYRQWLRDYFTKEEKLQLADFRDAFQTSRKYAQALLEYFDRVHFTERIVDYRTLYRK